MEASSCLYLWKLLETKLIVLSSLVLELGGKLLAREAKPGVWCRIIGLDSLGAAARIRLRILLCDLAGRDKKSTRRAGVAILEGSAQLPEKTIVLVGQNSPRQGSARLCFSTQDLRGRRLQVYCIELLAICR
ncbi:hypothetical protein IG631_10230 [Alternaria alternata]|nr:hypothetical protein IG631_10230 [Alternaria alternata]